MADASPVSQAIPTLKEDYPDFNPVAVTSLAKGYDAFSKTLQGIEEKGAETAKRVAGQESQTMYINSVADSEKIKTQAQQRMLEHPNQSSLIAKQSNDQIESIKKNAYVNGQDRTKLNAYLSGVNNDVALKATETHVKQSQIESANTFYENSDTQLKAIQAAMNTDPDGLGKHLTDAYLSQVHGLVSMRALAPYQAHSAYKALHAIADSAAGYHEMTKDANIDAQKLATIRADPINGDEDNSSQPINGSTQWLIDSHNNDNTFAGAKSAVLNHNLPTFPQWSNLKPAQQQELLLLKQGVNQAYGMLNSGVPLPQMEREYKDLQRPDQLLSYSDKAKRDALAGIINKIKDGKGAEILANTPMGSRNLNDFHAQNAAIEAGGLTGQDRQDALMKNKNDLIQKNISTARALHWSSDIINPVPEGETQAVRNAFQIGQDPSSVLSIVNSYTPENRPYLAQSMADPNQRMIVEAVATPGGLSQQYLKDFIAANQEGITKDGTNALGIKNNINDVNRVENADGDRRLRSSVVSELKTPLNFIQSTYPSQQFLPLQNAMVETTMKMAKYLAAKNGDYGNTGKYVVEAAKLYTESHKPQTGANWIINSAQMQTPVYIHDMDALANYAIREGNKYLKGGMSEQAYDRMGGNQNLRMIITPTNDIMAVNANGDVAFQQHMTPNILEHAINENVKATEEHRKARSEAIDKGFQEIIERPTKTPFFKNVKLPGT